MTNMRQVPAVMLLAGTLTSGVALPTCVPLAVHWFNDSPPRKLDAICLVIGSLFAAGVVWNSFKSVRNADPDDDFFYLTVRVWKVLIPISYLSGVGVGIYLLSLFYL